ncbi:MAG: ABC-2 family transporter protein [Sporanaerobacter sp.]|jgi:ABC-type transport system involved in multi-copper enzyme maturation permease subunit|uniref:ABC transporter permease subunit n=1 Tax=Sporanaerobacter sp. TaxID=2010183 RepID=UPI003A100978
MYLKTLPFNKNLFKKDFKMIKPIVIFIAIIIFFSATLPVTTSYNQYKERLESYKKDGIEFNEKELLQWRIYDVHYSLEATREIYIVISILVPIVMAIILFGEEKRRKTFEVLSTMPFTRYEIFFNKLLVSLVAIILPFVINSLIMLLALGLSSNLRIFYSARDVLLWCIKIIYHQMPVLGFSFLFGVLTGTTIAQFILTGIFLVFPIGFFTLISYNLDYWGLKFRSAPGVVSEKFVNYSILGVFDSPYHGAKYYIYYIILSIILLFLSKILFDKNKLERSGETLEFENIETFFKVGVSICFSLLMGIMFVWIFEDLFYNGDRFRSVFLVLGYVVGGFLGWFLSNWSIKLNRSKA